MNRAELLQDAVVDGLRNTRGVPAADVVDSAYFQEREDGRIVVYCPRRRFEKEKPASLEDTGLLRELIDEGMKVHGFCDVVIIEP